MYKIRGVRVKMRAILPDTRSPRPTRHAVRVESPVARARPISAHRGNEKQTVASDPTDAARRGLPLVGTIVRAMACSLDHEVKGLTRS